MARIVCCGSNKFYDEIKQVMDSFIGRITLQELLTTPVILPAYCDKPKDLMTDNDYRKLLCGHFKEIEQFDSTILVFDFYGYIGMSTAMEIGYAKSLKKNLIALCPPEDESIRFMFTEYLFDTIINQISDVGIDNIANRIKELYVHIH